MDISTGISSLQLAIDLAKGIKASKSLMDNAEVNMRLVELMGTLVDAKEENLEYKGKVIDLEQKVKELEEQLKLKDTLIYEAPFYWKELENGQRDGEFCQRCYDSEGKLSRLTNNPLLNKGTHHCAVCDTWYGKRMDPQAELNKAIADVWGVKKEESIVYEEPFYWKELASNKKEGPFCQKCYDADKKLARLIKKPHYYRGTFYCSICDDWYGDLPPEKK